MEYQDLKNGIRNHLNSAAEDFFIVGYLLRQINENTLFTEDGYKNIWDFAEGEYGLSTSTASRFMAINARFSVDGGQNMDQKYIGMGPSKLQEMLTLSEEDLKKVTKEMTVKQIRDLKKPEPTSYYGLTKSEYPEGSLISTEGCGNKHNCFSCGMVCSIRQKERYCRTAPLGNPFPCTQIGSKKLEYTLYKDQCMHLHPELAPLTEGSKEPMPCCLLCEIKECSVVCCDVAKKRREEDRKKEEAERKLREKEAENAKRDMTAKEVRELYDFLEIGKLDHFTGGDLKERYGKSYTSGNFAGFSFNCTPRGTRVNNSKEITWGALAKEFREIKETDALKETEPDIIDADFQEVGDEPIKEAEETFCDTCEHDGECVGKKTHDDGCLGYEEKIQELEHIIQEPESDSEEYGRRDVDLLLNKHSYYLRGLQKENRSADAIRNQRILVDALILLIQQIDQGGTED